VKDASHTVVIASAEDNKPSAIERSSSNQSRELEEAQEKMRELEFELERPAGTLKHSESENSQKYEELELSHKKLQEHIMEADEK
jgi:hypothetical protein